MESEQNLTKKIHKNFPQNVARFGRTTILVAADDTVF